MKSVLALFIVSVILVLSPARGQDCRSLSQVTLFPNPAKVGQTVHLGAVLPLTSTQGGITGGVLSIKVLLNDVELITFNRLPLCNVSSSIVCSSFRVGDNRIIMDLPIPKIMPGKYTAVIDATLYPTQSTYCQSVDLVIENPDQPAGGYLSHIQASLLGAAQFQNPNVLSRSLGDIVQVGPVGSAPTVSSVTFPWGTFVSITGSEDVVLPYTSTAGFVWGLSGSVVDISYSTTKRWHTYKGTFQVGYVSDLSKREMDFELFDGDFSLIWEFDNDLSSTLSGTIYFNDPYGVIPTGWASPVTVAKFGSLDISTTTNGILLATANKTFCPAGSVCSSSASSAASSSSGLSNRDIGLIVGLVVGVPTLLAVALIVVFWRRHRRHYEEEQGIFSSTRKPEYGNALVVDDIIQETNHQGSPELIPRLNRRDDNTESEFSDDIDDYSDDESQLSDHRRSRFGENADRLAERERDSDSSRSPSPPPRHSRSAAGPSHRRSRSPPRRRSPSPPPAYHPRDRSSRRGRSPSNERDASESYYSDAGSSASRMSDEE